MIVAIAASGNNVSEHFGRCENFMLVEIQDGDIKSREIMVTPPHQPGVLPKLLADRGVNCLVAGGIGRKAQEYMAQAGVEVFSGVRGSVEDALSRFLLNSLEPGGEICEGGKGGHGEGH